MKTKVVNWVQKDHCKGTAKYMQTTIEVPGVFQGLYDGRQVEFIDDEEIINKFLPSAFGEKERGEDEVPDTEPKYPNVHITYLDVEALIAEGKNSGEVETEAVPLNKILNVVQLQ